MHTLDAIGTPSGGTASTRAVRPVHAPGRWRVMLPVAAGAAVAIVAGAMLARRGTPPAKPAGAPTAVPAAPTAAAPVVSAPVPRDTEPASAAPTPTPRRAERRVDAPPAHTRKPARETTAASPEAAAPAPPVFVPIPAPPAPAPTPVPSSAPTQSAAPPPPPAPAPDPRPEIRSAIADYAGAIESRSVANLKRVYPGMTSAQQDGWERFFETVRDVKAQLTAQQIDVSNGTAEAQVAGTYTYTNTSSHQTEQQPVGFHVTLRRDGGAWRIGAIR